MSLRKLHGLPNAEFYQMHLLAVTSRVVADSANRQEFFLWPDHGKSVVRLTEETPVSGAQWELKNTWLPRP